MQSIDGPDRLDDEAIALLAHDRIVPFEFEITRNSDRLIVTVAKYGDAALGFQCPSHFGSCVQQASGGDPGDIPVHPVAIDLAQRPVVLQIEPELGTRA